MECERLSPAASITSRTGPGARVNTTAPAGTFQLAATLPQTVSADAGLEKATHRVSAEAMAAPRIVQFICAS
jgi:hypothetical protein